MFYDFLSSNFFSKLNRASLSQFSGGGKIERIERKFQPNTPGLMPFLLKSKGAKMIRDFVFLIRSYQLLTMNCTFTNYVKNADIDLYFVFKTTSIFD